MTPSLLQVVPLPAAEDGVVHDEVLARRVLWVRFGWEDASAGPLPTPPPGKHRKVPLLVSTRDPLRFRRLDLVPSHTTVGVNVVAFASPRLVRLVPPMTIL